MMMIISSRWWWWLYRLASVVLWLTISPPRRETPGSIPTSTKKIHDIYGAIWGKISCLAASCADGWFSGMVVPEPIVWLACVLGRWAVFRITCTLIVTCAVCHLWFNKRIYSSSSHSILFFMYSLLWLISIAFASVTTAVFWVFSRGHADIHIISLYSVCLSDLNSSKTTNHREPTTEFILKLF